VSDKDQRTEEATPKKRQESRKEGQTAKSQDVTAVASFVVGAAALVAIGASISTSFAQHTVNVLGRLDSSTPMGLMSETGGVLARAIIPVAIATTIGTLIAGFSQVGWNPTIKPLTPDAKKMNPLKKLKQMFFSMNSVIEVLKALAKLVIVGAIVGGIIYDQIIGSSAFTAATAGQVLARIGSVAFDIGWRAAIAMLLLALLDWVWQKRQFEQSIKMTKQEVKDEHKQMEGDPLIKGKRRARARQMAQQRAQAVSEAAVVIVNPTHVAVALRYEPDEDAAPIVVAKGVDEGAMRVRREARRHSVPIHHDPPLARQLARRVPTGKSIPPDLYRAVAAVLAVVLQARRRAG
jgi:flagellar biosynthesis protein FlhB